MPYLENELTSTRANLKQHARKKLLMAQLPLSGVLEKSAICTAHTSASPFDSSMAHTILRYTPAAKQSAWRFSACELLRHRIEWRATVQGEVFI